MIVFIFYDVVKVFEYIEKVEIIGGEMYFWVKIEFLDGCEGFVYGKFLRFFIGYCVSFSFN